MSRYYSEARALKKRYLVRKDINKRTPFVPDGLLPALGLGAVFFFGLIPFSAAWIQDTARTSAQDALAEIGANWAGVKATGQWVTIEGPAPSAVASRAAEEAVREATNRTPFGFLARPITRVYNKTVVERPSPPVVEAAAPTATAHNWAFSLDRGVMDLKGEVPNQATRAAILEAAARRRSPQFTGIRDQLTISGRIAPDGFQQTALRGINTLGQCDAGTADFQNGAFSLNCEAQQSTAAEIERLARSPLSLGTAGRIDVFSTEQAEACDQSLVDLLSRTKVEFASSSSAINPASNGLLDQVAEAAKTCPGTLRIEGHTDASGRASLNQRLSLQRAESVRRALIDRGVASARLNAEGFGPNNPIADNDSESGRARNRRIEIKVVRGRD